MQSGTTMTRQSVLDIISALFILLFVYAAITKLMDIQKFQVTIGQSPLLTDFAVSVSWLVPTFELIAASMLALPKTRLAGLLISLTLMVSFTTYIFIIMNFSEHVPCSCGGVLQRMSWRQHLAFNLGFVVMGIVGIVFQFNQKSKQTTSIKDILLQ
jgi:uncharacterized membrane protein YphA (DoxX/SURF4 family)